MPFKDRLSKLVGMTPQQKAQRQADNYEKTQYLTKIKQAKTKAYYEGLQRGEVTRARKEGYRRGAKKGGSGIIGAISRNIDFEGGNRGMMSLFGSEFAGPPPRRSTHHKPSGSRNGVHVHIHTNGGRSAPVRRKRKRSTTSNSYPGLLW